MPLHYYLSLHNKNIALNHINSMSTCIINLKDLFSLCKLLGVQLSCFFDVTSNTRGAGGGGGAGGLN